MRHYVIYLMSFLILLVACSREDFTGEWQEEVEIPSSENVEVDELNGIVRDTEGHPIENALLELFSDNSFVRQVNTNQNGEFSLPDLVEAENYAIRIIKEDHISGFIFLDENRRFDQDIEITLTADSGSQFSDNPLNPIEEDVVFVGARIEFEASSSSDPSIFYSWTGTNELYLAHSVDGYYSMILPDSEQAHVYFESACSGMEQITELSKTFYTHTDLGDIIVDNFQDFETITGFVFNCFGEPVNDSEILIYYNAMDTNSVLEIDIVDGIFEAQVPDCGSLSLSFELFDSGSFSSIQVFGSPIPNAFEFYIQEVCDSTAITSPGSLTIQTSLGEEYEYEYVEASIHPLFPDELTVFGYSDNSFVTFTVYLGSSTGTGEYDMDVHLFFTEELSLVESENGSFDLEEFDPPSGFDFGFVKGEFEAEVYDFYGNIIELEGMLESGVFKK